MGVSDGGQRSASMATSRWLSRFQASCLSSCSCSLACSATQGVEVRIGLGEFGVDLVEAGQHLDDGLHGLLHDLDDGLGFIELGFLLEQANGVAFGRGDLADVVLVHAGDDAQQRGFARAVQAEHADLGAVIEAERDVAQDHFVADGDEPPHFVHGVDDE